MKPKIIRGSWIIVERKIKWGIVGLGIVANELAEQFESDNAELVAVGSRSLDKARIFAEKYSVPKAYGSYQELYDDDSIDIVYLATPNSHHAENMIDILNADKHVFCEKAITMNKKELDEVLKLAKEKEKIVAEAMTIYHMPIYHEIKERISSGEFGELKLATSYFGSLKSEDPAERFFNAELGGGALLDIGVYALSFVQYFLDSMPEKLETIVDFHESGVDEKSTISYITEKGTLANITLSFRGKLPKQGVVVCENAYITFMDYPRADKAIITYPDGSTEKIQSGKTSSALNYEIKNISETLLSGEDFTGLDYTIQVNSIMDALASEWQMDWIFE